MVEFGHDTRLVTEAGGNGGQYDLDTAFVRLNTLEAEVKALREALRGLLGRHQLPTGRCTECGIIGAHQLGCEMQEYWDALARANALGEAVSNKADET